MNVPDAAPRPPVDATDSVRPPASAAADAGVTGPGPSFGWRGPRLALLLVAWTGVVILVLIWLCRPFDPSMHGRIVRLGLDDSPTLPLGDRVRHWLWLLHLSVYRAYPWVLLAPYLLALTSRFHLERGRWRSSGPVHLAACTVWLLAAAAVDGLSRRHLPDTVVFAMVETHTDGSLPPHAAKSGTTRTVFEQRVSAPGSGTEQWPALLSNLLARADETRRGDGSTDSVRIGADARIRVAPGSAGSGTNLQEDVRWTNRGSHLALDLERTHRELGLPRPPGAGHDGGWLLDLFAYASLVGLAHAWYFQRRWREREHRELTLETQLARTRLHALQAQLQPHFLFNALNSVTAMLRENPRTAEEMLISLSDLLRLVLAQSARQFVALRDELRFVELYVEIQQYRFGDRLRCEIEVAPEAWECQVPTLLLQPLVENAIRHGIEPAGRPGRVRVTARRPAPDRLEILVADDGVGCPRLGSGGPPSGVGLDNVRARLTTLFADAAELDFPAPEGGGFVTRVVLPALTATEGPNQPAR